MYATQQLGSTQLTENKLGATGFQSMSQFSGQHPLEDRNGRGELIARAMAL